jgi:hypothetical protein
MQGGEKLFEGGLSPLSHDLDRATPTVANPACQAEPLRGIPHKQPETDPLHAAVDSRVKATEICTVFRTVF